MKDIEHLLPVVLTPIDIYSQNCCSYVQSNERGYRHSHFDFADLDEKFVNLQFPKGGQAFQSLYF
jgi:hypothetical protein